MIRGAGDLASGAAAQLHKVGWRIVMTELPRPLSVRCEVCFSRAVYEGVCVVEGIEARRLEQPEDWAALPAHVIGVTTAEYREVLQKVAPKMVVDGIMAKSNRGLSLSDAEVVVALGPGFYAGRDCHAVIETQRGPRLGQAIFQGPAAADTGIPGRLAGAALERVLYSPRPGVFHRLSAIGDLVSIGQAVASVDELPIRSAIDGVLRGLLPEGTPVTARMKCGDVDPRCRRELCFTISDKSLRVGLGVLEAARRFLK